MHAFLICCVLAEAVLIGILFRRIHIGFDLASEHRDAIIAQIPAVPHGLTETNWSEMVAKLYEHTNDIQSFDVALQLFIDAAQTRIGESESKLIDLAEGCEKLDADLSVVTEDVRELSKIRAGESRELGKRITELSDEQEKIRRKAAQPGSRGFSFETIRTTAESNAKRRDPERDKLVALAEGPESV